MSFVDRLFPQAELEALGNKWHEPAPKRRKLDSGAAQLAKGASKPSIPQRRQSAEPGLEQRRHRMSVPTPYLYGRQQSLFENLQPRNPKRSNSDSQSHRSTATSILPPGNVAAQSKSCLPSFIEPSLLKNYLRHLHPKDSHRYTVAASPSASSHTTEATMPSPVSLIADSTPSPASTDSCPTPAAMCDQFRSGPFGHIFDGMRLTANERNMMEDLLSPTDQPTQDEARNQKRKLEDVQVEVVPADSHNRDETLLNNIFPSLIDDSHGLGIASMDVIKIEPEDDVYSSGLSSAAEELEESEKATSHRGIIVYDYDDYEYDAVSVDDFFDLDEAST